MGINRDIKQAMPRLQLAWAWLAGAWAAAYPSGPRIMLSEVFRTAAVQNAYFAQGRKPLKEVNELRKKAGLYLLTDAENKRKITFKPAGNSKHELLPSKAFDIAFIDATGKLDWSSKHFDEAAKLLRGQFPDVTWGGDWDGDGRSDDEKFVDRPHFQV